MEMGPGTLVRSKAGRDKGALYAVIRSDEKYVYVADGERFPLCRIRCGWKQRRTMRRSGML